MKLQYWWSMFWASWLLVGVVAELVALWMPRPGDTLSEQVWTVLSIPGWGSFLAWMLVAFLLWLSMHFSTRWV